MTATTEDLNTPRQAGEVQPHPVGAATIIYLGSLVASNAAGYLVSAEDDSALKFEGIAAEGCDNSDGADGALNCKVYKKFAHEVTSSGLTQADVGCDLYVADNKTVQKAPTNVYAGKLARYKSATVAPLDIAPALAVPPVAEDKKPILLPLAANANIASGDGVAKDGDGYLVAQNAATAIEFMGVAMEAMDNTGGADGAKSCWVQQSGVVTRVVAGALPGDIGAPVFASGAAAVTKTPASDQVMVGRIAKYNSAVSVEVDIEPGVVGGRLSDIAPVGVAAAKAVNAGAGVALDADGYLVDMDDVTAVSFWGVALNTVDNAAGADGALSAWVARRGRKVLAEAGGALAAVDVGKDVWQSTDAQTCTVTPGDLLIGHIEQVLGVASALVSYGPMPVVGHRIGRQRVIPFAHADTIGAVSVDIMPDAIEVGCKCLPLRGYVGAVTGPDSGASETNTTSLTDGATDYDVIIAAGAKAGKNETPGSTALLAGDLKVKSVDSAGTATTDNLSGHFLVELL